MQPEDIIKERITNYIQNVDFKSDNYSVNTIKKELSNILNQNVSIEIDRENICIVNEVLGEDKTIENIKSVDIWYTYEDTPKMIKIRI